MVRETPENPLRCPGPSTLLLEPIGAMGTWKALPFMYVTLLPSQTCPHADFPIHNCTLSWGLHLPLPVQTPCCSLQNLPQQPTLSTPSPG